MFFHCYFALPRLADLQIIMQAGSCRDVITILSRMPCEGLDDQQLQSLVQMKEIASGVVNKRAKVATIQNCEAGELVC